MTNETCRVYDAMKKMFRAEISAQNALNDLSIECEFTGDMESAEIIRKVSRIHLDIVEHYKDILDFLVDN